MADSYTRKYDFFALGIHLEMSFKGHFEVSFCERSLIFDV